MRTLNILKFTVIILLFLTFKLEATPTVQYSNNGNSGTLTLTSDDCSYEGWSHFITINIPANKLVKYTLTTNTYDYLEIWSSTFFNCIDFPESYSHTIISSEGKIYIYCQDNGYGLPNTAVFYFSFELDTPATLTPSNAYIPGYLGIGTSSPQETLHINGNIRGNASGGALRINTTTGYMDIGSMNSGWAHIYTDRPNIIANTPIWSIAGAFSAYQTSDLKLQTNGTTRMTISAANGNVGIGTTPSSSYKLEVSGKSKINGDIYGSNILTFQDDARFTVTQTTVPNLISSTFSMPQYGLAAPGTTGSADLWMSGHNGIKLFTDGNATPRFSIAKDGKVSIGTIEADPTPNVLLTVKGTIHTKEVLIDLNTPLADYVFNSDYTLMPLHKVEAFVKTNKHLPEIPSAAEVKEKGLSMGEMQNKLLQKIEELTLYVIEQQKRIEQLEKSQK